MHRVSVFIHVIIHAKWGSWGSVFKQTKKITISVFKRDNFMNADYTINDNLIWQLGFIFEARLVRFEYRNFYTVISVYKQY
jgi:hypothetical protein